MNNMFNIIDTKNNMFNIKTGFNRSYKKIDFNKLPKFNNLKIGEKLIDLKKMPTFNNLKVGEKLINLKKLGFKG